MKKLIVFASFLFLNGVSFPQAFTDSTFHRLVIEDYYGASGHAITYVVTRDSLKILTNCDFVGCEEAVVYKQVLNDTVSTRFSKAVFNLRIDTLQDRYTT